MRRPGVNVADRTRLGWPRRVRLVTRLALTVGVTALGWEATAQAAADPRSLSLAIVVGSNRGPSPEQETLRFGDDDAIQSARTLAMLGADATLLVTPDAETRELFPAARPQGPATRAAMKAAFQRAGERIAAAHAEGRHTRLYFFFAGHGDLADGRPFLQLEDGRLWREDLAEMLRLASADDNHVLVDACYASAFVADRGPGGERTRLLPGFSRDAALVWPARTGFLTARSASGQTHEWAEFQAGIFSHELRSGMIGAADVNLDGKVTYREIAAFVQRANEAIPNRRYRPEVSTAPPDGDLDTVLADLPDGPLVLEMDLAPPGHTFVETARGVRLADLHPGAGPAVRLRLPTNEGPLFVQQVSTDGAANGDRGPREFPLPARAGRVRLSALAPSAPRVRARGAAHEAFLLLFRDPFDSMAVQEYQLPSAADMGAPPPLSAAAQRRHRLGRTALELGVLAGALAGACAGSAALVGHSDSPANSMTSTSQRNGWIRGLDDGAWVMLGVAGAALTTGAILLLLPDKEAPRVTATALSGGAAVGYRGTF
ncbi:MAG TPA: hypothetical protein VH374_25615 [Polyangia bacterium]|nr:hypothetical protein [Polyangia bacterium]